MRPRYHQQRPQQQPAAGDGRRHCHIPPGQPVARFAGQPVGIKRPAAALPQRQPGYGDDDGNPPGQPPPPAAPQRPRTMHQQPQRNPGIPAYDRYPVAQKCPPVAQQCRQPLAKVRRQGQRPGQRDCRQQQYARLNPQQNPLQLAAPGGAGRGRSHIHTSRVENPRRRGDLTPPVAAQCCAKQNRRNPSAMRRPSATITGRTARGGVCRAGAILVFVPVSRPESPG